MMATGNNLGRTKIPDTMHGRRRRSTATKIPAAFAREYVAVAIVVARLRGAHTRAAVAAELGVDERTLRRYERGSISTQKALQLLRYIKTAMEETQHLGEWTKALPELQPWDARRLRQRAINLVEHGIAAAPLRAQIYRVLIRAHDNKRKRATRSGHNSGTERS